MVHFIHFIEVPVPNHKKRAVIYVLGVSISILSTIFLFRYWTVLTMWYFLFSQILECSDNVVFFVFLDIRTVLTMCYFWRFQILNCSDNVVFFVFLDIGLFWQSGIFCFSRYWTVLTMWYFLFFISLHISLLKKLFISYMYDIINKFCQVP